MKRVDLIYVGMLDDDFDSNRIDFFNPVGPRDFDADSPDMEEWEHSPFNVDSEDERTTEIGYQSED